VKRQASFSLMLCLMIYSSYSYTEMMQLEVIPLQNRSADEIIPILQPLVHDGGTLTGMNNQLIIKTTSSNLIELKQILSGIDKAARRLMITVKQNIGGNLNTQEHNLSGLYSDDNVSVSSRNRGDSNKGLVIEGKDSDGNKIRYRNLNTQSNIDDKNTFSVQTIDGKEAFIQTGQQVPIRSRNSYLTNGGVVVQDSIDYHDVSSGFYVLPRVNGDRVTLFISPQLARAQGNQTPVFEIQNAETTTVGRLGEWMEIGGISQHIKSNTRENLGSRSQRGEETRTILVKVEGIQ
jgi:type II secretory pathway component GspD/PulD (secretin)